MVWYKDDPDLLEFEVDCFKRFVKEYGENLIKVGYNIVDGKVYASVVLKFRVNSDAAFDEWKFLVMYSNDHVSKDEDGRFGGSIKIHIINKIKDGFHHVLTDNTYGKYICQTKESSSAKVNAYFAMKRLLRWLVVYYTWRDTGVDIDL